MSLLGRLLGGSDTADDEESDADPWPYLWDEERVETFNGSPVRSIGTNPAGEREVFAGPRARSMITGGDGDPDDTLWVGVGVRSGYDAGVPKDDLLQHTAVYGTNGYGKSTLLTNAAVQFAEAGAGFAYVDPKGDDALELLQRLPEHRLDDVVWLEPGGTGEYATGFNFLDVGVPPSHPMFDTLRENVVADLKSALAGDDHWGPLMDGVAETLIRASAELPHNFALDDLYAILKDEEDREALARLVEICGLSHLDYTEKIADMEEDRLDAILRRLKAWAENPTALRVTSFRETGIDFEQIVDDGKILVVRLKGETKDLKRDVTTSVFRRLWSTIRTRDDDGVADPDPFYLFADEFDITGTEESGVVDVLSRARASGFGLVLSTQYPTRLPGDVLDAMNANADTTLSFGLGATKDRKVAADALGMDASRFTNMDEYRVWMRNKASKRSGAFKAYTLPPLPPRRSREEAKAIAEECARRDGRPRQSVDEITDARLIDGGDGVLERDGGPLADGILGAEAIDDERALRAVADAARAAGDEMEWIPLADAAARVRAYCDLSQDTSDDAVYRGVLQRLSGVENTDEEVRVTEQTLADLDAVDGGAGDGGMAHLTLLRDAFDGLRKHGVVEPVTQGGDDAPDGLLDPTPLLDVSDDADPVETADAVDAFRDEHPTGYRLTGGRAAHLESEHSTARTKGGATVRSLARAIREGRRAVFLARPDTAPKVWDTLAADPPLARSTPRGEATRRYYNAPSRLTIDGEPVARPGAAENVWLAVDGALLLRDGDGREHARFDSPAGLNQQSGDELLGSLVKTDPDDRDDLRAVYAPVIPEEELGGREPADVADEWHIVVVPEKETNGLSLYVDGLTTPLSTLGTGTSDDKQKAANEVVPDVPDGAVSLLETLREHGEPATRQQAYDLVTDADGPGLDVSDRTVRNWVNDLKDAGALVEEGRTDTGAQTFRPL